MADLVTVTWDGHLPNGVVATKPLAFQITSPLFDAGGDPLVVPELIEVSPTAGLYTTPLYPNNDPQTTPEGTAYKVYYNQKLLTTVVIPYDQGTVDLATLPPASITPYNNYATQAALDAEIAERETVDETLAIDLGALTAEVDTLSTGYISAVYSPVSISSSTLSTAVPFVFIAPFTCVINYAAIVTAAAGIAASDTDYWSVELRRYRAGVSAVIATKTTRVTGGQAVTQYVPWVFGTLDPANKVLQAGDTVAFFFTETLNAASWSNIMLEVGYTPT